MLQKKMDILLSYIPNHITLPVLAVPVPVAKLVSPLANTSPICVPAALTANIPNMIYAAYNATVPQVSNLSIKLEP